MNNDNIYNSIRARGGRITRIRKEIVRALSQAGCLLSQDDILDRLRTIRIRPCRSTLYRELLYLSKNRIVTKNTISDVHYYEISSDHHHHLICNKCDSIEKVVMNNHLKTQEGRIAKRNKFSIISHSLDFYGVCHKCMA